MARKSKVLLFLITITLIISLGTWVLGSSIQSPAEAAARTEAPEPSLILHPIEYRVLTSRIISRGTAHFDSPHTLSITPSKLKSSTQQITRIAESEEIVHEGDAAFHSSGRPVFLLKGDVPVFRDFNLGNQGADILQLEQSLTRLGFDSGPLDGLFDDKTAMAIQSFYSSRQSPLLGPTEIQASRITQLEQQRRETVRSKSKAESVLTIEDLRIQAIIAQEESRTFNDSNTLAALNKDRIELEDQGLNEDHSELESLVTEIRNLELQNNSDQREFQLTLLLAQEARNQAEQDVDYYNARLDSIDDELHQLKALVSSQIPADEIQFVPELPSRIEEVLLDVGDPASGAVLTLTNNAVVIDSSLPLNIAPLVQVGTEVKIDEPNLGIQATGVIQEVASNPGTNDLDAYHVFFRVLVTEHQSNLDGISLRLTVPIESTQKEVPVVPQSALTLSPDGSSRIQILRDNKTFFLEVSPGLSADGFVELVSGQQELLDSDMVVIGYEETTWQ
jgi:peptidoglycan hydrolase-like protein with peptidoglycan-binding domain